MEGNLMRVTLERRQESLRAALNRAGLQGVIVNRPAYIYHLTDWLPPVWASVFLVVSAGDAILVSPFVPDGIEPAWSEALTYTSFALDELVAAGENARAALEQALSQAALDNREVGAALTTFPGSYALPISQRVRLHDVTGLLHALTAVKDAAAQQAIRERVAYLDRAFEAAQSAIRAGVSETSVFGAIFTSLTQSLGGPLTLDCTIGSGPRSLQDEPQPTGKLLAAGEVVLVDLFPVMGGYAADYTRNFVVGQPTDDQRAQHAALEKALAAVEAALRPGMKASQVDRLVRGVIEQEGFGDFAHQHHSGHAFGLTIPEPPWLIPADHTSLEAGMVIAVEPGIYHPVNGGMRLEGNYLLHEDGCEPLAGFPVQLIGCP